MDEKPFLKRKFYGRRKGRSLGKKRDNLVASLLPHIKITLDADTEFPVDPTSFFSPPPKEVWLEIGFGQGEHLSALAQQHPNIGFIGCEPFINGVSALLCDIQDHGLENIRIWPDDARDLMDALPDQCLDRCFLIHPDPWPKTKHHKRRFIQNETVDTLARLLKSGAELRIATDDPDLCNWMLEHIDNHSAFQWLARCQQDWQTQPEDWPVLTKYGQKQLAGTPVYLLFERV